MYTDYSQGSIETTNSSTDLAIGGNGYFCVKSANTDDVHYTRAGNFTFNSDGYLVDTNGLRVQGWAMEKAASTTTSTSTDYKIFGSATDIRVTNFQAPASATTKASLITNLDPTAESQSTSTTDPFFSLFETWDGTKDSPINSASYGYSSTIKVYDDTGTSHTLTVYYDKVTMSSNAGNYSVWQYMVTCNPDDDNRTIGTQHVGNTSAAGVLMMGTMTFSSGVLVGESAYTLKSNATGDLKNDLSQWKLADFSTSGYPTFTANFTNASNASATNMTNAQSIELDLGMRSKSKTWSQSKGTLASNASMIGTYAVNSAGYLPSMGNANVSALSTQSYDTGGSSTLYVDQDGYTAGYLQNVSVDENGVLTGKFSNGQQIELYSVELATFTNQWGLRREGSNLYSATNDSGAALTGTANTTGKGTITSNALEASNVDMAGEFVNLIVAQRGFEANSKVITTADTLLSTVISMKR
jgi:flagellar hook protein FlgE